MERQRIVDQLAEYERIIADLTDILARPERQRKIISDELAEIVDKYGDERRTKIIAADGDLSNEDLIPDSDVVVTITARRLRQAHQHRPLSGAEARRQGRTGQRCAPTTKLITCSLPPITTGSCSLPTRAGSIAPKCGSCPRPAGTPAAGMLPGCCPSCQMRRSHRSWRSVTTPAAPYLLLATKRGLVKKTALPVYDSPRQAGIIAVNFREEDDELIGAELCSADDEVLLISRKGLSIRFPADDSELRPMGRATSGVTGMKFRPGDELLSMSVIRARASDDERLCSP